MTIPEIVSLLQGGPIVVMLIFIIIYGFKLLRDGTLVLGSYHNTMIADRDKIIDKLTTDNVELSRAEKESRELAWKATDIGQTLAKMKDKGTE